MPKTDINGRPYVAFSELKVGDFVEVDGGFTCLREGAVCQVEGDGGELYVRCADGRHKLEGQLDYADNTDALIGVYRSAEDRRDPNGDYDTLGPLVVRFWLYQSQSRELGARDAVARLSRAGKRIARGLVSFKRKRLAE